MIMLAGVLVSGLLGAGADKTCHAVTTMVTDAWCNENCNISPPNCPPGYCKCDGPAPGPTPPPPPTPAPPADSKTWVVLAAGSSTYWNYRHQADICHAYQIVKGHGVDPDRIITLIYDDVATDPANPFPGQLFNQPNGSDVYGGCKVDYRADALSPSLFLNVLLGDSDAVQALVGSNGNANGKVLKSGPDDNVFVYFADHGGSGMIMFPGGAISASELTDTIKKMHSKSMYRELVFYLDTCKSGSMFTELPTDINAYAVSSARPDEDANAIWCYEPDTDIQGKNIGACLGDSMSVGWMMDSDAHFQESFAQQFTKVKDWSLTSRCSPIPCFNMPCQYGDMSITNEPIGSFQGQPTTSARPHQEGALQPARSGINARDVKLALLKNRLEKANSAGAKAVALEQLHAEEAHRKQVDDFFANVATRACASIGCDAASLLRSSHGLQATYEDCHPKTTFDLTCHKKLLDVVSSPECTRMQWGDYSAKYSTLLVDMCNSGENPNNLAGHLQSACAEAIIA